MAVAVAVAVRVGVCRRLCRVEAVRVGVVRDRGEVRGRVRNVRDSMVGVWLGVHQRDGVGCLAGHWTRGSRDCVLFGCVSWCSVALLRCCSAVLLLCDWAAGRC